MTSNLPVCGRKASDELDRKLAERDALLDWLQSLERQGACPEAGIVVQSQLRRVVGDIEKLQARVR